MGGSAGASGGSGGAPDAADAGSGGSSGAGDAAVGAACSTQFGKALQFDGTKVDIFAGDLGADLPGGNSNRTIELWAKFTGPGSWVKDRTIIETGKRIVGGNQVLGIRASGTGDGILIPYTDGFSGGTVTFGAFSAAGWKHLAWSFDTETGLLFTVDGAKYPVQMGDQMLTMNLTAGIVTLGASQVQALGALGWDGVIDEVKIWSVSKSAAEIYRGMRVVPAPNTPGLVAYYRFNEGSGDYTDDESKHPTHRLRACAAAGPACPQANDAHVQWVDSDLGSVGPFTCAN
jgi:hypothetical protein